MQRARRTWRVSMVAAVVSCGTLSGSAVNAQESSELRLEGKNGVVWIVRSKEVEPHATHRLPAPHYEVFIVEKSSRRSIGKFEGSVEFEVDRTGTRTFEFSVDEQGALVVTETGESKIFD